MTLKEQQDYFFKHLGLHFEDSITIRSRIGKAFKAWFQALIEVPEQPALSTKENEGGGGGGGGGAPPAEGAA